MKAEDKHNRMVQIKKQSLVAFILKKGNKIKWKQKN